MRVYKFLDTVGGISVLRTRRIRISRMHALNDPFEFLGADLSDRKHRRALKATKATMSKNRGLICFSKSWSNPVLWGHYAEKYQGLCLGFDVPGQYLRQVSYVNSRFPWPEELSQSFMEQVLFTKFVHWSYEDEFRIWAALSDAIDGHYYADFSPDMTLKEVIVGPESTLTRAQVNEVLGDLKDSVDIFKVRPAFRTFRVVRNRNNALWK